MKLVADIGGTNARFAVAGDAGCEATSVRSYRNAEFGSFEDALARYMDDIGASCVEQLVAAVAGPVKGGTASLTNLDWEFCETDLARHISARKVRLINDLTALGYASTRLGPGQLVPLANGAPNSGGNSQALVVGIGTGFNVSPVIPCGDGVICPSVEAGHASLPTRVARELARHMTGLDELFPTIEHCFSGRGLQQFLDQVVGEHDMGAASLVASYGRAGAERVTAAIDFYAEILGHLLRDLSLTYLPTDGIFLAGGVTRSVLSKAAKRRCAHVLRQPSRFNSGQIPVWVIVEDTAALIGCARIAMRP